ncbi:MAG: hypothetical protein LC768_17175 [Acidobacteria bacterium]|nr:hypothetical protein [Acidobacteriota bacterium]MCA1640025.1 hypothetical protein [Acidobacteriota bacterium]
MPKASISDNGIVYRAIRSSGWIDENNNVALAAFVLRESDKGELSILLKANCVLRICSAGLKSCWGEILLNVEKVKKLNLEIKPAPLSHSPDHAVILNLPLPENFIEAERMATLLVDSVESVHKKPEKYGQKLQL